jgi:tRNA A37 N6-isopentenylltransferase MiaA
MGLGDQQVYQGLDVGTAKPTRAERDAVQYHLIDVCPFEKQFHAGDFVQLANVAIKEVLARGNTPIVVGGPYSSHCHLQHQPRPSNSQSPVALRPPRSVRPQSPSV